jgi:hypothetical protein
MVLVDQSNWYHGRVTLGTPVADTSPNHDWTTVAVMNVDSGQFGRDNPTFGFIYPQVSGQAITTLATAGFQPPLAAARTTYDPSEQAGLFHFAVAEDDRYSGSRRWAHRRGARYSPRFAAASHRHGHSVWHSHSSERATHHTRTAESGRHPHSYQIASGG